MVFAWSVMVFLLAIMLVFMKMTEMGWLIASSFAPIIVVFGIIVFASRKTCFELSPKGLEITGDWCGESFAWHELDVASARIVRFRDEPGLRPKWKTAGLAMPGYASGSFRLYNKSRALIFLTDKNEAIYLPTRKEYGVLLSATNNPEMLAALQHFSR